MKRERNGRKGEKKNEKKRENVVCARNSSGFFDGARGAERRCGPPDDGAFFRGTQISRKVASPPKAAERRMQRRTSASSVHESAAHCRHGFRLFHFIKSIFHEHRTEVAIQQGARVLHLREPVPNEFLNVLRPTRG